MKDWLQQALLGEGPAEGPLEEALLDLFWMMPWWFPQVVLTTAGLWLLFLWLARRRRLMGNKATSDGAGPTVRRSRSDRLRTVA